MQNVTKSNNIFVMFIVQKMHCSGHVRYFPNIARSQRTSSRVLFAYCQPFAALCTDPSLDSRSSSGFWTKHELDLKIKHMDER